MYRIQRTSDLILRLSELRSVFLGYRCRLFFGFSASLTSGTSIDRYLVMMNPADANYSIYGVVYARENLTNVKRPQVSASMEAVLNRDVWKSEFITRISHEMRTPLT